MKEEKEKKRSAATCKRKREIVFYVFSNKM
jgi:hypothetical protein